MLNAALSKSKYVSKKNGDGLCSAGFDALDASDWLVCDTRPITDEVSPLNPGLEHPPKPTVKSIDTLNRCFLMPGKFISKLLNFLEITILLGHHTDRTLGDGNSVTAHIERLCLA